jgi:hypothetical protein
MLRKIIYINQLLLTDITFKRYPLLENLLVSYYPKFHTYLNVGKFTAHANAYFRSGVNLFPFDYSTDFLNARIPQFELNFNLSFEDVCDKRCLELLKTHSDKPWHVLWSGGTDSTTILVSILRNTTPKQRKNIFVSCNRISVYENPRFFNDYIFPNFSIVDSSAIILTKENLEKHYYFDGHPADNLYSGKFPQSMLLADSKSFNRDIKNDPDQLVDFIAKKIDREFAVWFYDAMIKNINSVDVPIKTYHDFFWWIQFNLSWISNRTFPLRSGIISADSVKLYFDNYIQWYNSKEFQLWAMRNNDEGIKYGNTVGEYKLNAKKYIYDYTKDEYFYKFKTKMASGAHLSSSDKNLFCLTDDYSILTLEQDYEEILNLLPTHLTNNNWK